MAKNPSHSLSRGIEIGATKRRCFETALHNQIQTLALISQFQRTSCRVRAGLIICPLPSRLHNSIICLKACLMREDDGVLEYIHKENWRQAEKIPQSIAINRRYRESLPDPEQTISRLWFSRKQQSCEF